MPSTTRTIRLHPLLPPTEHHGDPLPNLQIPTSSTPATLDLLLAHLLQQPQKKYTYTITSGQNYNAQKQQQERIEDVYYSPTENAPQKIGEIEVEGFVHAVGIYEEGIRVGTRNDIQQYTLSKEMQVKIKGHTTAISETHHALITGEILHTKHQHKNSYYAHDAKPTALLELDGNLVAAYDDGAIVQHEIHQNVSTNKRKKGVAAHKIVYTSSDKIYAMKNHSIKPQVVMAAGNDVRFVDLEVGNVVQQRCFSTVAFDVDIKNVMTISGHADKTIKLFDARENGKSCYYAGCARLIPYSD